MCTSRIMHWMPSYQRSQLLSTKRTCKRVLLPLHATVLDFRAHPLCVRLFCFCQVSTLSSCPSALKISRYVTDRLSHCLCSHKGLCQNKESICRTTNQQPATLRVFAPYYSSEVNPWALLHCCGALQAIAIDQSTQCKASGKGAWALRATDPELPAWPQVDDLPDPAVYLASRPATCNSYIPLANGLGRLLWSIQYLIANGMYVVVSTRPL